MVATKEGMLQGFGRIVSDLGSRLRSQAVLTETEQLVLENRVMMLQCEYHLWAHRPITIIRHDEDEAIVRGPGGLT